MTSASARIVLPFLCASFLAAALVSCGGGGSSDDPVALCKQGCGKISLCLADAGSLGASAKSMCESNCSNSSSMAQTTKTCSNSSAITSAFKGCLNKSTCNDWMTCVGSIPACQGGSTGGGTAGGTSGGKAGSTGAASGGTCADLLACCNRTSANLKAPCMMAYTSIMSSGDMACGIVLSGIKASYCP